MSAPLAKVAGMHDLLHRLLTGDPEAGTEIVAAASTSDDVSLLVAAALLTDDCATLLDRAGELASSTRDRQLVAIAVAHGRGDRELVRALAQDHLVDHPDNVLVAWIAAASHDRSPLEKEER